MMEESEPGQPVSAQIILNHSDGTQEIFDIKNYPHFKRTELHQRDQVDHTFHLSTVREFTAIRSEVPVLERVEGDLPGYRYGQWFWSDFVSDQELEDDLARSEITKFVLQERAAVRAAIEQARIDAENAKIQRLADIIKGILVDGEGLEDEARTIARGLLNSGEVTLLED